MSMQLKNRLVKVVSPTTGNHLVYEVDRSITTAQDALRYGKLQASNFEGMGWHKNGGSEKIGPRLAQLYNELPLLLDPE